MTKTTALPPLKVSEQKPKLTKLPSSTYTRVCSLFVDLLFYRLKDIEKAPPSRPNIIKAHRSKHTEVRIHISFDTLHSRREARPSISGSNR